MNHTQRIEMYRTLLQTARNALYRYVIACDWDNAAEWQQHTERLKHLLTQAEQQP